MTEQLQIRGKGTTFQEISAEVLGTVQVLKPPCDEQRQIECFLDHETAKIDALIQEQQRLIELLNEKRQAVISHVVTKGLDPAAPMKDSGIDWIGDVPKHWSVQRLSNHAAVENGTTPARGKEDYWSQADVPWIASGEVNQVEITNAKEYISLKALEECSLRILSPGTVVVAMIGQGKTRAMAGILCLPAAINQNLAAISPRESLDPNYLLCILTAAYESLREDGRGGQQAALNCRILSSMQMAFPPLREQREIAAFVAKAGRKMECLEEQTSKAITLLQERRSALISAAVTGKIDVRNYRPRDTPTPDELYATA